MIRGESVKVKVAPASAPWFDFVLFFSEQERATKSHEMGTKPFRVAWWIVLNSTRVSKQGTAGLVPQAGTHRNRFASNPQWTSSIRSKRKSDHSDWFLFVLHLDTRGWLTSVRHIDPWNRHKNSNFHNQISILVTVLDCKFFVSQCDHA